VFGSCGQFGGFDLVSLVALLGMLFVALDQAVTFAFGAIIWVVFRLRRCGNVHHSMVDI
jgi:hypothetical protein